MGDAVTHEEFRKVLSHFATGVSIVTTMHQKRPIGITINSLTSVSLDPPLVLFCLKKASTRYPFFRAAPTFLIHILESSQSSWAVFFAKATGHFGQDIPFQLSNGGNPRLPHSLAQIECTLHQAYDGGDHKIILGKVEALSWEPQGKPLIFYKSAFQELFQGSDVGFSPSGPSPAPLVADKI